MEDEFAPTCDGVNAFGHTAKAHAPRFQCFDGFDEVFE